MKGDLTKLNIDGRECALYLPPDYGRTGRYYPVVYMNGSEGIYDIMERTEPHFDTDCEAFILVSAEPLEWNDDFSPWPAPALSVKDKAFGGLARVYLKYLSDTVKPMIDARYRTLVEQEYNAIVGYSLGGLTSLYAIYYCPVFGRFASISGSLWFDGWTCFAETAKPLSNNPRVYISLGKGEERSRNPRMAEVGECTRRSVEILRGLLNNTENLMFQLNEGGHFTDIAGRYERALVWLMKK